MLAHGDYRKKGCCDVKKLWNHISRNGKLSIVEFLITILTLICGLFLLVLDFSGKISLGQEDLVRIAIILLEILIASSLIERFGILSSIYENLIVPDKNHAYLTVRDMYNRAHPVDDDYSDITEMCVMAIANTSFLRGNGITSLKKAAQKGIKVKLLSINPTSDLASIYETSKILSSTSIPLSDNIEYYKRARKNNKFQKNVTLKVCKKIIPYSLMILKRNDQIKTMKIDLYSNNVEYTDRRSIIIPPTDIENIRFFLNQWEFMWNQEDNSEIT